MSCALIWPPREYVPAGGKADEVYARMLKKPAAERLKLLRSSEGPQGQFLWAILRNSFHYAAVHLASIADNARDVDFCMRWGFGMKQGPFELWQEAGWQQVANMVKEDIDAGKALCKRAAAGLGVRTPSGPGDGEGLAQAVELAEKSYQGVVIWSGDEPVQRRRRPASHAARLHDGRCRCDRRVPWPSCSASCCRLRYANVPVVSAVRGWPWAVAASWRCTPRRAWRTWKATWAWSKWAWAWCPVPVA
jgi:hypothetical protein